MNFQPGEGDIHHGRGLSSRIIESISGLTAGFTTTIVTHPLDVIKIRLQLSHLNLASPNAKPFQSIISVIEDINNNARSQILQKHNHLPRGLLYVSEYYRGLMPNLVGNISAWGLYFALYAEFKSYIKIKNNTLNYFTSSTLAGLSTGILTNPIWVLKTRIVSGSRSDLEAYRSMWGAAKTMLKHEGVLSFWKGAVPGMFQVFQGSLHFTIYDLLKNFVSQRENEWTTLHLNSWQFIYISAISKISSSVIMYPAQVVKSRLQNNPGHPGIMRVVETLYYKEGGYRAFYKGLSANIIRVLPATCITFVVYENVKKYLTLSSGAR